MNKIIVRVRSALKSEAGMELLQVAMLVGIAIVVGLIFRKQIGGFVTDIFNGLSSSSFK